MSSISSHQADLFRIQAEQEWTSIAESDLPPDETWLVVRDNKAYHSVHRFHPYFAMCPPPIARRAIEAFSEPGDWVADPFCGAGVTMVEAMLVGRNSIGVDILSMATFISKVKTTVLNISPEEAFAVADRAEILAGKAGDAIFDTLPAIHNRDYWFSPEVQRQLAAILAAVDEEPNVDKRDFLRLAMSGIVRPVSNAGNLEAHLHIKIGKPSASALKLFRNRLFEMVTREKHFKGQLPRPIRKVKIHAADSRKLQALIPDETVDFILTSPPYGTGTKYASIYRLQMELLGLPRPVKPLEASADFGAELSKTFAEMHRILKPHKQLAVLYGTNKQYSARDVAGMIEAAGFRLERIIACPVIDHSKMVRGDYRRSMANEHLLVLRKLS